MAVVRGEMRVENAAFGSGTEILNRPPYEAVAMTIDFSSAVSGEGFKENEDTKELYVPAGMPINKDGVPKHDETTDVVGILLYDVYQSNPQGAVLKKAYINEKRAKASSGVDYKTFADKLPMIVFEELGE